MNTIFLGGTCGKNEWRKNIVIPALLRAGIPEEAIFNPVVAKWTKEDQEREDEAKRTASINLFVIASPDPTTDTANVSAYSIVEAIMGLYDDSARTVIIFDLTGMPKHTAKALNKAANDLVKRFPDAPIYEDYKEAIGWIVATYQYRVDPVEA